MSSVSPYASRVGLSTNSREFPFESTARYRYVQVPLTLKYISSTRQESVVTFRWGHQRFSSSEAYRWTRAKDGRIVNLQSPFQHDYFQVSIAERILAEAPTNAQEHDICLEMTPFEQMLWLHEWESSTFERSHYG